MFDHKKETAKLEKERATIKTYLEAKFQAEDWHGVQDAASDLRDIDSELKAIKNVFNYTPSNIGIQKK